MRALVSESSEVGGGTAAEQEFPLACLKAGRAQLLCAASIHNRHVVFDASSKPYCPVFTQKSPVTFKSIQDIECQSRYDPINGSHP